MQKNYRYQDPFEQEHDYYKPIRVGNFQNDNYVEYENNGDRNRNLSLKEYLNRNNPHLRDIIIDLQESDTWKIQLTIAISLLFLRDVNKESVMHSRIAP